MANKLFLSVALLVFACALPLDKINEKVHADGPVALIQQPSGCSQPVVTVTEFCIHGYEDDVTAFFNTAGTAEVKLSVNGELYYPLSGGFKSLKEDQCHSLYGSHGVTVDTDADLKMELLEEDYFKNDKVSATLRSDQWNLERAGCDADYMVKVAALFDSHKVEGFCVDDECVGPEWKFEKDYPKDSYVWIMKVRVCDLGYQPVGEQCCPSHKIVSKDKKETCCPGEQIRVHHPEDGTPYCGVGVPAPPPGGPPASTSGCTEVTGGQCCPNGRILEKITTSCCPVGEQPIGEPPVCTANAVPVAPAFPAQLVEVKADYPCPDGFGRLERHTGESDHGDVCRGPVVHGQGRGWKCPAGCEFTASTEKVPYCSMSNDPDQPCRAGCEPGLGMVTSGECCPNDRIKEDKTTSCCPEGQVQIGESRANPKCGSAGGSSATGLAQELLTIVEEIGDPCYGLACGAECVRERTKRGAKKTVGYCHPEGGCKMNAPNCEAHDVACHDGLVDTAAGVKCHMNKPYCYTDEVAEYCARTCCVK